MTDRGEHAPTASVTACSLNGTLVSSSMDALMVSVPGPRIDWIVRVEVRIGERAFGCWIGGSMLMVYPVSGCMTTAPDRHGGAAYGVSSWNVWSWLIAMPVM